MTTKYDPDEAAEEASLQLHDGEWEYDPTHDQGRRTSPRSGWRVRLSGEDWWETKEDAERGRQEYAIAIANRVHGDELARLRSVEDSWVDLVKRMREVIIHTLEDCKAANLALTDRNAVEVFDEASIAVALPISNDDGVPFELIPPTPDVSAKPSFTKTGGGWAVYWGIAGGNRSLYAQDDFAEATADFGERYAAWKNATS